MWSLFTALWSTPYGHFLMPYGVLHVVTISCHMEYSIWSLWSSYSHVQYPTFFHHDKSCIFGSKKICGSEKNCAKKDFMFKNILCSNILRSQKILGTTPTN